MSISQVITDFTTIAIQAGGWMEMDRIYVQNRLLHLIGEDALENTQVRPVTQSSLELLDQLLERALTNQVIENSQSEKEQLTAQIMDFLTPPPSVVNALFAQHYSSHQKRQRIIFSNITRFNIIVLLR